MSDLIERLRALARSEHSDFSIGDESADEIERLTVERDEIAARLESAVDALTHKRPLMTTAKTVDDWRRIAEHLDFEWSECSRHLNKVAAQRDEARAERDALRDVLLRHGFVPCDIPACNCGSWHARFGYPERLREIADALDEAGHPLSNENGNMPLNALRELIAERDALAKLLLRAGDALVCNGDLMSDGDEWQESHACGRCDERVDRNWVIRTEIRAAIAQIEQERREPAKDAEARG